MFMKSKSNFQPPPGVRFAMVAISTVIMSMPAEDIATFSNRKAPADGSGLKNRLKVGTGEFTDFTSIGGASLTWEAKNYTTGANVTTGTGSSFSWRAPFIVSGSNNDKNYPSVVQWIVTATRSGSSSGGYASNSWIFNVHPPQTIVFSKTADRQGYGPSSANGYYIGAGFYANAYTHPRDVSFEECEHREYIAPPTNQSGYFGWINQHPAGAWTNFTSLSFFEDFAGIYPPGKFFQLPSFAPPSAGTCDWDIPNHYRLVGASTYEAYFHSLQQFSKPAGSSMTVTKGAASATRNAISGGK